MANCHQPRRLSGNGRFGDDHLVDLAVAGSRWPPLPSVGLWCRGSAKSFGLVKGSARGNGTFASVAALRTALSRRSTTAPCRSPHHTCREGAFRGTKHMCRHTCSYQATSWVTRLVGGRPLASRVVLPVEGWSPGSTLAVSVGGRRLDPLVGSRVGGRWVTGGHRRGSTGSDSRASTANTGSWTRHRGSLSTNLVRDSMPSAYSRSASERLRPSVRRRRRFRLSGSV